MWRTNHLALVAFLAMGSSVLGLYNQLASVRALTLGNVRSTMAPETTRDQRHPWTEGGTGQSLMSAMLGPKEAKVTPLFSKDLTDLPGKEGLMITVEYPPGSSDPVHRHNAHAFVYVLEGSIVMQVRGGKEVILTPGQSFYEGPSDVHVVGRNASQTNPAKFVVFLVKDRGAPALVPAK